MTKNFDIFVNVLGTFSRSLTDEAKKWNNNDDENVISSKIKNLFDFRMRELKNLENFYILMESLDMFFKQNNVIIGRFLVNSKL